MNWYFKVLKDYAVFTGRATRQEYWMFFLFNFIIAFVLGLVDRSLGTVNSFQSLATLYQLAVMIPGIAVGIRRMHDINRSGWWLLMPLANLIFLCEPSVDPDETEPRKMSGLTVALMILVPVVFIGLIAAVAVPVYRANVAKAKVAEQQAILVAEQARKAAEQAKIVAQEAAKDAELNASLITTADAVNKNLPMMVDAETRLDSATAMNREIRYSYTMINYSADDVDTTSFREKLEPQLISKVCTTEEMKIFVNNHVPVTYSYADRDGKELTTITVQPDQCKVVGQPSNG